MTRYLDPQEVADRLGVTRRTAMCLMMEMNPIHICGNVRRRYRVTEANLEQWMAKRMTGRSGRGTISMGSKRRLERR